MREAPITQSPHVFVPKEHMSEKEREEQMKDQSDALAARSFFFKEQ